MRGRITEMRNQLVKAFEEENLTRFSFIKDQHGMFSYSGLGIKHAAQLREKFGIYILDSGRICIAALNKNNLKYVTNAISTVINEKTRQAKSFLVGGTNRCIFIPCHMFILSFIPYHYFFCI